jgi:chloramphenicol 3-O-phosphotransferase
MNGAVSAASMFDVAGRLSGIQVSLIGRRAPADVSADRRNSRSPDELFQLQLSIRRTGRRGLSHRSERETPS